MISLMVVIDRPLGVVGPSGQCPLASTGTICTLSPSTSVALSYMFTCATATPKTELESNQQRFPASI
jgi:hypothetical protein